MESSSAEEKLGILVDYKLSMRQQSALVAKKASGVLGWTRQRLANRSRDVILSHILEMCESCGYSAWRRGGLVGLSCMSINS